MKTLLKHAKNTACSMLLCIGWLSIAKMQAFSQCTLPKPSGVTIAWITSCDAMLTWNEVPGAAFYQVKYKLTSEEAWTKVDDTLTVNSYRFIHLSSKSEYKFQVAAYCTNGASSGWKSKTAITKSANEPSAPYSIAAGGTYTTVGWMNDCPCTSYNLRYKKNGSNQQWIIQKAITISSFTISELIPNAGYKFSVQSQMNSDTSAWSPTVTINSGIVMESSNSANNPNMILYLLDDGRYDSFRANGGPSWFETPSIDRIANEGVNFQYAFATTSQCGPSRVSIYTGLYAHRHGAIDNNTHHKDGLTMIQHLLQDAGYYTGFIGKYGQKQGMPQGFDWWLTSDGNVFENPDYTINGKDTLIEGHISDVYQWAANEFLESVPPGKKFMLMFFTRAPHGPTIPRPEDTQLYTDELMPFPANFSKYQINYPSYFYENTGHEWHNSIAETDSLKRLNFQCLHGVERNISALFEWLTGKNLLDSTLFIFSSDNGNLEGEHMLNAKQLGQEHSIRVPMFIRYPAWFSKGVMNSKVQALNIDIAPTMLDAAGITDTMDWDGISLRNLFNGSEERKYFYYQFFGEGEAPEIRGLRTNEHIYLKHYCNSITEEFYDLVNDPGEITNLINETSFTEMITLYRNKMDSLMIAVGDTEPVAIDCYLSNPVYPTNVRVENEQEFNEEMQATFKLMAYPNPASGSVNVVFNSIVKEDIHLCIENMLGQNLYRKIMPNTNSFHLSVETEDWNEGTYLVTMKKGADSYTEKLVIQ